MIQYKELLITVSAKFSKQMGEYTHSMCVVKTAQQFHNLPTPILMGLWDFFFNFKCYINKQQGGRFGNKSFCQMLNFLMKRIGCSFWYLKILLSSSERIFTLIRMNSEIGASCIKKYLK